MQQAHFDQQQAAHDSRDGTDDGRTDKSSSSTSLDTLLFVQHEPVYTFGTASDYAFLLDTNTDIPTVDISRGGEITYHGPGQLVVYPILNLCHYQQDLHWYIRALEEAAIRAISDKLIADRTNESGGVTTRSPATTATARLLPTRYDDITGVWLDNHKIAAIGVHARRWVTQHGVAINVEEQCLKPFRDIVPCGLTGRKVGCLNQFLRQRTTVAEFAPYMLEAIKEIFQMEIVAAAPRKR